SHVINKLLIQTFSPPALDARTVLASAALGQALHAGDDDKDFADRASQAVAQALERETNVHRRGSLATGLNLRASLANVFGAVAGYTAPELAGALAQRLAQALEQETDSSRLASLATAFGAVAGHATSKQVDAVAQRLIQALERETDWWQRAGLA